MAKRREVVYMVYDQRLPWPQRRNVPRRWSGFVEEKYCIFLDVFDTEDEARAAAAAVPPEAVR